MKKSRQRRPANHLSFTDSYIGLVNELRDVDPLELRVTSTRRNGPDPFKLQRQIAAFGSSTAGMPPPWVYEASDGVLVLYNGVTRAVRIAKLAPGTTIPVRVIGRFKRAFAAEPKIGDYI